MLGPWLLCSRQGFSGQEEQAGEAWLSHQPTVGPWASPRPTGSLSPHGTINEWVCVRVRWDGGWVQASKSPWPHARQTDGAPAIEEA